MDRPVAVAGAFATVSYKCLGKRGAERGYDSLLSRDDVGNDQSAPRDILDLA